MIPADPHGAIGTARFRRTLAWHIARRPGGLVALAIQYGHMQTALTTEVSGGYATRSRNGIHDMIALETALATAETAADLHEHFESRRWRVRARRPPRPHRGRQRPAIRRTRCQDGLRLEVSGRTQVSGT